MTCGGSPRWREGCAGQDKPLESHGRGSAAQRRCGRSRQDLVTRSVSTEGQLDSLLCELKSAQFVLKR